MARIWVMNKEEFKLRLMVYREILRVAFHMMVMPSLYMICMWGFEVAAAFLFFQDLWRAMGFVSAIALYQITQAEFNKEYFGKRK